MYFQVMIPFFVYYCLLEILVITIINVDAFVGLPVSHLAFKASKSIDWLQSIPSCPSTKLLAIKWVKSKNTQSAEDEVKIPANEQIGAMGITLLRVIIVNPPEIKKSTKVDSSSSQEEDTKSNSDDQDNDDEENESKDDNNITNSVLSYPDAMKLAKSKGLDLVLINPNSSPPVAKIMSLGKYKYAMEKRRRHVTKNACELPWDLSQFEF